MYMQGYNQGGSYAVHENSLIPPSSSIVPSPAVNIIVAPTATLFAGSSATLNCTISLNGAVDTGVAVAAVWRKSGVPVSSGVRIMVSNAELSSPFHYESSLTFSTLSMDDGGEYSCEVTVNPEPFSQFIVGTTGSDTTTLSIQGKVLIISHT